MSYEGEERRRASLTKEDVEEAVRNAFTEHKAGDEHVFLAGWMAKERRKQELWEKIKAHVGGWGAVAVLGYLLLSLGDSAKETLKHLIR